MALPRIERRSASLADRAYEGIVEALTSGELAPGDRLVMDRLARDLDISRTPVRDALARLEREGLIHAATPRGYVVPPVDSREVARIYQAREAVEGFAAREVAGLGRAAAAVVEEGAADAARIGTATSDAAFRANRRVHRAVVEATGNPILVAMFDDLWGRSLTIRAWQDFYVAHPRPTDVSAEHAGVVAAIRSGSSTAAERAMLDHIRAGHRVHAAGR
jgi:DNA-binding GntR family transcriptional regulator